MATKGRPVFHIKKSKSLWSGRVTALCGWTREAGQYRKEGWFESVATCPDCERIKKQGDTR